jgi:hypothetical protein
VLSIEIVVSFTAIEMQERHAAMLIRIKRQTRLRNLIMWDEKKVFLKQENLLNNSELNKTFEKGVPYSYVGGF